MPRSRLLDFQRIRAATSFADVLAWYDLPTPPPGRTQWKINCPFHDDDTPSCSINVERGLFNCFGCPAEGNVLDFIAEMEGDPADIHAAAKIALTIIGAEETEFRKDSSPAQKPQKARQAATRAKSPPTPKKQPKSAQRGAQRLSGPKDVAGEITENPVKDIELELNSDHPFLQTRHVTTEIADIFGMGYCQKGIMRGRIAIPLHNQDGELIGYTGRWAEDGAPPAPEQKYKLPKGFKKSLDVYNLHRASALRAEHGFRYIVIVEGIWSVIRLHTRNVPTVALLGTSCSPQQAEKIAAAGFRYAVVILDGDDAGRAATPEVVHVLSQQLYVKTLVLPDGVKPDTMDDAIVSRLVR